MDLTEKTVSKNYVYKGRIINVRCDDALLPDGKPCKREVVEHNGGVCIAPITDDGKLIFVRQFRYPYSEVILELPAGKLELGEDPFKAGKRELEEETGMVAAEYFDFSKNGIYFVGRYAEIVFVVQIRHLFFAISYMRMPAATEALSELILPFMGRETIKSHFSLTRRLMPFPSEPTTRATLPE